jgi:hypothetical protein
MSMSPDSSSVVKPSLVGVGGWLAFFCAILLVVNPLMTVVLCGQTHAKHHHLGTIDPAKAQVFASITGTACGIAIAMAVFGFVAGFMLAKRAKGAVLVAKAYVLCVPVVSLLQFLFVPAGLPGNVKSVMTAAILQEVIKSSMFCAIWFSYLCVSRRVKATYSTPTPQRRNESQSFASMR